MPTLTLHAYYLEDAIRNPQVIVRNALKALSGVNYDTLVGTGLSGALVLPLLSEALHKQYCIVRKADNSHSHTKVEGSIGDRWVFIDDLISTGTTQRYVQEQISWVTHMNNHVSKYVGAFLYYNPRFVPAELGCF